MFRRALIKMTLLYLLIIMAISLFFSFALFQVLSQEIQGSLRRQQGIYEQVGPFMHDFLQDPTVLRQRDAQILISQQQIIFQLLYTNIVILIIGGGLSYWLASLTIRPIEEAHDAQARFTGDASHELRSPLASMKTEIEVALRVPNLSREEAIDILKSNLEEVERLGSLSDYLLQLAREDAEPLKMEKVPAKKVVQAAIVNLEKDSDQKKIKIVNSIDTNTYVYANSESLKEIFSILLENAIKYSETGQTIRFNSALKGQTAELIIQDEGIGISAEDLPHIFERFYRADHSRCKNHVEGYGLGLALAQQLAEANHTEICVESNVGKGSTFKIKLPLKK